MNKNSEISLLASSSTKKIWPSNKYIEKFICFFGINYQLYCLKNVLQDKNPGEFFRLVAGARHCRDVVACADGGLQAIRYVRVQSLVC